MTPLRAALASFVTLAFLSFLSTAHADALSALAEVDGELGLVVGAMRLSSDEETLQAATSGLDLEISYPLAEGSRLFLNTGIRAGTAVSYTRGQKRTLAPQTTLGLISLDIGGQQPIGESAWLVDASVGLNAVGLVTSNTFSYSKIGLEAGAGVSRWFAIRDYFRVGAKLRAKILTVRGVRDRWTGQSLEISLSAGFW